MRVSKEVYMEVLEKLSDYEEDPSAENTYEIYITLSNIANAMKEDIA